MTCEDLRMKYGSYGFLFPFPEEFVKSLREYSNIFDMVPDNYFGES